MGGSNVRVKHHDHIHVALAPTQEVVRITHDRNRSGKTGYRHVKETEVVVDKQALIDYLTEYHNPRPGGTCKADGQDWPCKTYSTLRKAAYE